MPLNHKKDRWIPIADGPPYGAIPPEYFDDLDSFPPDPSKRKIAELYILIEHDVIGDGEDDTPFVRKARIEKEPDGFIKWILLDYDPETEEEILQQYFTVVAWRFV